MLLAPAVPPVMTMPLLSALPLVPIAGKIRLTQYRMIAVRSLKDSCAVDLKLIPETNKSQSVSLVVKQQQAIGEVAGSRPHTSF
jgi:hypothetical protein